MSPWLLVVIAGSVVALSAAWGLVWKFRASTRQWQDVAEAWEAVAEARERIVGRQQAIVAALQMVCRHAGVEVTISDQADGVDLVILPVDRFGKRAETRH